MENNLSLWKIISCFLMVIVLNSCQNDLINNQQKMNVQNASFYRSIGFKINNELKGKCFFKFKKILTPVICNSEKDSIKSIFGINATLYKKHYSLADRNRFVYFMCEKYNFKYDTTDDVFFCVDKNHSELHFLNYIKKFKILTIDHSLKIGQNFTFLNKNKCVKEHINPDDAIDSTIYYQNITFDQTNGRKWFVDSVSKTGDINSIFKKGDTLNVLLNKMFVKDKDTFPFRFKDYQFYIKNIPYSIVSSAPYHKILFGEKKFIFMTRLDKER